MGYSAEDHEQAIANTKQAIQQAIARGDTHEADFLMKKTLPCLEQRLLQAKGGNSY
ncbi:hypothetical protein NSS79_25810 [Paenibacillus sp. FSL L8-0436]|uniref:hypothetical protein n=1 Tax=Paenibacillus sp. FSL L8-0436 TaxID=2954686 RepID=UPI0031588505